MPKIIEDKQYGADRLMIDGLRHYPIPGVPKPLPSVTSILGSVQPESSKQRLVTWNLDNPGKLQSAGERGTWIHGAAENYLNGRNVSPPNGYEPFWHGMPELLDTIKEHQILWAEEPFGIYKDIWPHAVTHSGLARVAYYNEETKHGYSGAPDLIYREKDSGLIVLADFKTSECPYIARLPKKDAKTQHGITQEQEQKFFAGKLKYEKCAAQLAAYAFAIDLFLNLKIDKYRIIVSTNQIDTNWNTQSFTLSPWEIERAKRNWILCYQAFWAGEKVDPFTPCRQPKR